MTCLRHQIYPTHQIEIGRSLMINRHAGPETLEYSKDLLTRNYNDTKRRVERDGDKVFCKMGPLEIITKEFGDIFPDRTIMDWKATISGRAFYVKRLGHVPKPYKLHPNKTCVPKRKRGKWMLRGG